MPTPDGPATVVVDGNSVFAAGGTPLGQVISDGKWLVIKTGNDGT